MSAVKVSFPAPCSEPWDGMAPRGCNRHCAACDTVVHDLAALTVSETEALLDSGEKICVRAEIDSAGRVRSADFHQSLARPLLACAGASLSLLAAACQTTPGGSVADGHTLTGQVPNYFWFGRADITSSEGQTVGLHVGRDRRFDVHDLRPGTYRLTFTDSCGDVKEVEGIEIADRDVDLGRLDLESTCIIVGQMQRADDDRALG